MGDLPGLHCLSAVGRFFTSSNFTRHGQDYHVFIAFRLLVGSSQGFHKSKAKLAAAKSSLPFGCWSVLHMSTRKNPAAVALGSSLPFGCWSVLHRKEELVEADTSYSLHCLSAVGRFFTR